MIVAKVLLGLSVISLIGCTSAEERKIKEEKNQAEQDSIRLLYNPNEADKAVDAFMQNLHKKAGFNGNVLIAKKGKIIYEKSFGWLPLLSQ